jgi:hypothetical protein
MQSNILGKAARVEMRGSKKRIARRIITPEAVMAGITGNMMCGEDTVTFFESFYTLTHSYHLT